MASVVFFFLTGSNQATSSKSILLFLCELFFFFSLSEQWHHEIAYNNDCYKIGSRIIRQASSA